MKSHLDKEEHIITNLVLNLSQIVKHAIEDAFVCYKSMDLELADKIIDNDLNINELEHQIETECVQLIAIQQPVAHDLREILSDIKISNELERIADYAVSIAKIVQKISATEKINEAGILNMADECLKMYDEVINDYSTQQTSNASQVAKKDDLIDQTEIDLCNSLFTEIQNNPANAESISHQIRIVHYLERMADRVTNIAEQVIFLSSGKRVDID